MNIISNNKMIIFYIILVLAFYGTGKLISKCDRAILKKIIKSKKHKNATYRMVNNYWGNMISVTGAIIAIFLIIGPTKIEFYAITVLIIIIGYIFHLSDVLGISLDEAITYFIDGNDKAVKQYFQGTICCVLALLAAGVLSVYLVAPIVFKEPPVEQQETGTMVETNHNRENEFLETIQDAFK